MFNLLVDTCVWLDIAKDHRQATVLDTLEALLRSGQLRLLLPRIVVVEFLRNKDRVIEESSRSLSSSLKRVKEAVHRLGEGRGKRIAIEHLEELDYKLPRLAEAAVEAVIKIEALFASVPIIESCDRIILRAADRAVKQRAPFHRQRNSMNDAILIEMYAELVNKKPIKGVRFGFVTHNTRDFSHPSSDNRLPHPDIASYFSKIRSQYLINLAEILRRIDPRLVTDAMIEREWHGEPRTLAEIVSAIDQLTDKVWYDRHQLLKQRIAEGKIALVDSETFSGAKHADRSIRRDIWQGALKGATMVEKKYGVKNLGPWSEFEWGMINGKLSALRWVLGDDWDMLDT